MTKPWRVLGLKNCSTGCPGCASAANMSAAQRPRDCRLLPDRYAGMGAGVRRDRTMGVCRWSNITNTVPASYRSNCPPDTWNRAKTRKSPRGANCPKKPESRRRQWRYLGRYFIDGNRGCGGSISFLVQQAPGRWRSRTRSIRNDHAASADAGRGARGWVGGQIAQHRNRAAVGLALAIWRVGNYDWNVGPFSATGRSAGVAGVLQEAFQQQNAGDLQQECRKKCRRLLEAAYTGPIQRGYDGVIVPSAMIASSGRC